jgi:hypothetical protein
VNPRRVALAALLRQRTDHLVGAISTEGARTTLGAPPAGILEQVRAAAEGGFPIALEAVAAEDGDRERLLLRLREHIEKTKVRGIPAVLTLGLARLGVHLARQAIRSDAASFGYSAAELEEELSAFEQVFMELGLPR